MFAELIQKEGYTKLMDNFRGYIHRKYGVRNKEVNDKISDAFNDAFLNCQKLHEAGKLEGLKNPLAYLYRSMLRCYFSKYYVKKIEKMTVSSENYSSYQDTEDSNSHHAYNREAMNQYLDSTDLTWIETVGGYENPEESEELDPISVVEQIDLLAALGKIDAEAWSALKYKMVVGNCNYHQLGKIMGVSHTQARTRIKKLINKLREIGLDKTSI